MGEAVPTHFSTTSLPLKFPHNLLSCVALGMIILREAIGRRVASSSCLDYTAILGGGGVTGYIFFIRFHTKPVCNELPSLRYHIAPRYYWVPPPDAPPDVDLQKSEASTIYGDGSGGPEYFD